MHMQKKRFFLYKAAHDLCLTWSENLKKKIFFFRDAIDSQQLLVHDGKVYIITIATGSEVKVVVTDLEGTTLWTKTIMSAWLDEATK